jgi:hypothetical protein
MTSFKISIEGDADRMFEQLGRAKTSANRLAVSRQIEVEVVNLDDLTVAHLATYVEGRIFHPYERIELPKFSAPSLEGFRPAYTRKRIQATVYRALDHSGWLIHDGRTDGMAVVRTTKQACAVTNGMRAGDELPAMSLEAVRTALAALAAEKAAEKAAKSAA